MTPQAKKKLSTALTMVLAILGALVTAGQMPERFQPTAAAAMTVLGVVISFLPALLGDVPEAAVAPVADIVPHDPTVKP